MIALLLKWFTLAPAETHWFEELSRRYTTAVRAAIRKNRDTIKTGYEMRWIAHGAHMEVADVQRLCQTGRGTADEYAELAFACEVPSWEIFDGWRTWIEPAEEEATLPSQGRVGKPLYAMCDRWTFKAKQKPWPGLADTWVGLPPAKTTRS